MSATTVRADAHVELTPQMLGQALARLSDDQIVGVFRAMHEEGQTWVDWRGRKAFSDGQWCSFGSAIAASDDTEAQNIATWFGYYLADEETKRLRRESACSMFHFNRDCPSCGWKR